MSVGKMEDEWMRLIQFNLNIHLNISRGINFYRYAKKRKFCWERKLIKLISFPLDIKFPLTFMFLLIRQIHVALSER